MSRIIRFHVLLAVFSFYFSNVGSACPYLNKNNQLKSSQSSDIDSTEICAIAPPNCEKSGYRTIDGLCNNLEHPTWAAAQTPYANMLPYKYGDGLSSFARSVKGFHLPNPRLVSRKLFPEKKKDNKEYTLITMQVGQTVAHDMSRGSGVPQTRKVNITCCTPDGRFIEDTKTNPLCAPIKISTNDPFYGPFKKVCMDFVRTRSTKFNKCTGPCYPSKPLTAVSGYLDLSFVYGNFKSIAKDIREFSGGRLITVRRDGQEWPPQDSQPDLACDQLDSPDSPCYRGGDVRFNQNTHLTLLQVVFLREHNRIAGILCKLNPHWNDEKTFQEARRILIAIFQRITYYHYLPIILGYDNMVKNGLIYPNASSYVNDYNCNVDASVSNEHATSAFRYFHTNIQGSLLQLANSRSILGDIKISDHFNNPKILEEGNNFTALAIGLITQPESEGDKYYDKEITNLLFKAGKEFGDDLRAIDIHRSRDHGLPSYRETRAACGLSVPNNFDDLTEYIPAKIVKIIKKLYTCIEDLDMIVGGSLEHDAPHSQFGFTFLKISTDQFYRTRVGDRYFFENGEDPKIAFTPSQLQAIRGGASLARLLCDNVPGIRSIQLDVFRQISAKNRLVPCSKVPAVDLNLWKEGAC